MKLSRTVFRAIIMVSIIGLVGGTLLHRYADANSEQPIEFVSKSVATDVLYKAPDKPAGYPEELPALDNVKFISIVPQPGAILIHAASGETPQQTVKMVEAAFDNEEWKVTVVKSDTEMSGSATKGKYKVGVQVSTLPTAGTPKGWTTIELLFEKEAAEVIHALRPQQDGEAQPQG